MTLSIIIPTYNEAAAIGPLVQYLKKHSSGQVVDLIVADGGSTDDTLAQARAAGAKAEASPQSGRAAQMNFGASLARGSVLYFVHADSYPPPSFVADIAGAVAGGAGLGRYRTRFNTNKTILKINAWFTRFDFFICMGGDQTLFVRRGLFDDCGGFNAEMKIMEEYEFCQRARAKAKYAIMKGAALISDRKYHTNTWLQVQRANARVVRLYRRGAPQQELVATYRQMLQYRKSPV